MQRYVYVESTRTRMGAERGATDREGKSKANDEIEHRRKKRKRELEKAPSKQAEKSAI